MDRQWKSGAAGAPPTLDNASNGYATNGNPGGGVAPTVPGAHWYHMVTEELLALVAQAGIVFDKTVTTQVRDAVMALVAGAALPRSYLAGYGIANNGVSPNTQIDIAAGVAMSSDQTTNLIGGAMTKDLSAVWAAGSAAGGRIASEALVDGTWHVYAFKRTTGGAGVDYCFSQSLAPTLPDSGTKSRRIASIIRAGGNIRAFIQTGDDFDYVTPPALDKNGVGTTANRTLTTVAVPAGIKVKWKGRLQANGGASGSMFVALTDPAIADVAPLNGTTPLSDIQWVGAASSAVAEWIECWTNTSSQIGVRCSQATDPIQLQTTGWTDKRGRDA